MVDTPPSGPERPQDPSSYERWLADLDRFDREHRLRAAELDLRRSQTSRGQWLQLGWMGLTALGLLAGLQVAWRYEDIQRDAVRWTPVALRPGGGLRGGPPSPTVVLAPAERDALAVLRGRLNGLAPGSMLSEAAIIGLLDGLQGAGKLPAETAKKLADVLLDGGKEITVHAAEALIDKLLESPGDEQAGASVQVTQICAPSLVVGGVSARGGSGGGGNGGTHHSTRGGRQACPAAARQDPRLSAGSDFSP